MRYILYLFTMILLFVGGMLVGNTFLPTRDASRASAVSAPGLTTTHPVLQTLTREQAQQDLQKLTESLKNNTPLSSYDKIQLLNHITLRLAMENFEFKRTKLELEIAKNDKNSRPTAQLIQATNEYNQAREHVLKLAEELFPSLPASAEQPLASSEPSAETPAPQTDKPASSK